MLDLYFKARAFSWHDSYNVFDEDGNTVFSVSGRLGLSKLKIHDKDGSEVAVLHQEMLHLVPHFKLIIGGKDVGVMKGKFSIGHSKYVIDFNSWVVEGDFFGWNYTVTDKDARQVMHAQKKLWKMTDTFNMEVDREEDALLCLLIVLAVSAVQNENAAGTAAVISTSSNHNN